jgi:hypothetical protein
VAQVELLFIVRNRLFGFAGQIWCPTGTPPRQLLVFPELARKSTERNSVSALEEAAKEHGNSTAASRMRGTIEVVMKRQLSHVL